MFPERLTLSTPRTITLIVVPTWDDDRAKTYLNLQANHDRAFAPFDDLLVGATIPLQGRSVLDVGCGAGSTLQRLAKEVMPDGRVTGVDIAEPFVEASRLNAEKAGLTNVSVEQADAQTASPSGRPFDVVVSRLGVMFFDDLQAAFTNLFRLTKSGGRIAFVCWQSFERNRWIAEPYRILSRYVGELEHSTKIEPYRLADEEVTRRLLLSSGYENISISPFNALLDRGSSPEATFAQLSQMRMLGSMLDSVAPSDREQAREDLLAFFERHYEADAVRLPASAWLVTGGKP